jgi:hypothetical protein
LWRSGRRSTRRSQPREKDGLIFGGGGRYRNGVSDRHLRTIPCIKILFLSWTALRNSYQALVAAVIVWIALGLFQVPISLSAPFWVFAVIFWLAGFSAVSRLAALSSAQISTLLTIDVGLAFLATIQSVLFSLIPTGLIGLAGYLLSPITGRTPDWLHIWLFLSCILFPIYRLIGKRKAAAAWTGK